MREDVRWAGTSRYAQTCTPAPESEAPIWATLPPAGGAVNWDTITVVGPKVLRRASGGAAL